jgi:hypothetical protein
MAMLDLMLPVRAHRADSSPGARGCPFPRINFSPILADNPRPAAVTITAVPSCPINLIRAHRLSQRLTYWSLASVHFVVSNLASDSLNQSFSTRHEHDEEGLLKRRTNHLLLSRDRVR